MNSKFIPLCVLFCLIIGSCKQNSNNNYIKNGIELKNEQKEKIEPKETIYFDEKKQEWRDKYGKCETCTFENGFNPHGWLLSKEEMKFVPQILDAEKKYHVDLKWNRITSQEILDDLLSEVVAEYGNHDIEETSPNNEKTQELDFEELNNKLANENENLSAQEVMKIYYPHRVETTEGHEKITISEKVINNGNTVVILIHDNLLDDSVKGEKYQLELKKISNRWVVVSIKKNWKCWKNRGQINWGIDNCN